MSTDMIAVLTVSSNVALVLVTFLNAVVDWHKDNALVKVVRTLRPSWHKAAKCVTCRKEHAEKQHGEHGW